MSKLKIAIQKNGRLNEKSLGLLLECGIRIPNGTTRLRTSATNFPVEILFLRDDDIPQYVEQQVADVGILGENVVLEKDKKVTVVEKLGFASCRLSLAIRKEEAYTGVGYFNNKKVATSYPKILSRFFEEQHITAEIEEISGSVEIAPGIGLADAVCDIVSTGSTLFTNGLKEVDTVMESQAVLITGTELSEEKTEILNRILFRIKAVRNAREHKYIMLNTTNDKIAAICKILPGINSPTIIPLAEKNWSSLHSVIKEDQFWEVIHQLKQAGAEGILVSPIEKMIY